MKKPFRWGKFLFALSMAAVVMAACVGMSKMVTNNKANTDAVLEYAHAIWPVVPNIVTSKEYKIEGAIPSSFGDMLDGRSDDIKIAKVIYVEFDRMAGISQHNTIGESFHWIFFIDTKGHAAMALPCGPKTWKETARSHLQN